jgi:radical SAM enzyme (TIGR01210 family)
MKGLNETIKSLRDKHPRSKNPREYINWWVEKDVLEGEIVDAFVMILRTRGCGWALKGGCSMCGYINDAVKKGVGEEDILFQFVEVMRHFSNEKIVKIFTSGSFLDEEDIPKAVEDKILKTLDKKTEKIIVETRPEFVSRERLKGTQNLEIALGLESANDFVSENSVNKGYKLEDYIKAATILNDLGIGVKTYLLIKPPFLMEREAINDAVKSAEIAAKYSQTISFNPVNVQRFTLVEKLWRSGEYRTPWLWSVVEVLKQSSKLMDVRLMSSPTAGGTKKGAHNCGKCDAHVLKGIKEFSLTQDISFLDELNCDCKEHWQDILSIEAFPKTYGDLFRLV